MFICQRSLMSNLNTKHGPTSISWMTPPCKSMLMQFEQNVFVL
jgi:hypothetical protein